MANPKVDICLLKTRRIKAIVGMVSAVIKDYGDPGIECAYREASEMIYEEIKELNERLRMLS